MNALRTMVSKSAYLGWLTLLAAAGCGSPLVGLECLDGYEQCGSGCYDLTNDPNHCGGCDIACGSGLQCVSMQCSAGPQDGSVPDGALGDSALGDGSLGDGGVSDGGDIDARVDGGGDASDIDARTDGGGDAGPDIDARSDGAVDVPDGATVLPDGAIVLPDGAIVDPVDGDADVSDGGDPDAEIVVVPPVPCTGPGSPADCVCDLGQRKCGLTCVNILTDHDNCGGCGSDDPSFICAPEEYCNGVDGCALICTPPLTLCNGACVDFQNDDSNCNGCGIACGAAAACIAGDCVGEAVGHVVTIGHDMSAFNRPIRQMVGNAVFLAPRTPVRILAYDEYTSVASRSGASTAIQQSSTAIGRAYTLTTANPALVTEQLADADVFVIEPQQTATNQQLADLGSAWSNALRTFLFRGGVVLLFDGGGTNDGTYQVLKYATQASVPLFDATARVSIPQRILSLVRANDAVAGGVSTEYQSQGETVGFQINPSAVNPGVVVIRDALPGVDGGAPPTGLPIVIHATTAQ